MKRVTAVIVIFLLGWGTSEMWHRFLRPQDNLSVVLQLRKERGQDAVMSLDVDIISQRSGQLARVGAYLEKGKSFTIVGVDDKIFEGYDIGASTSEVFVNPSIKVGTVQLQH